MARASLNGIKSNNVGYSGGYNGASGGSGGGGGCGQGSPGSGGVGGSGTANQGYGGGTARAHNNADNNYSDKTHQPVVSDFNCTNSSSNSKT
jgi:hypothetical protein